MIERYTLPEMGAIWSEQRKIDHWLAVEIAVCEAWARRGVIPEDAMPAIRQASCSRSPGITTPGWQKGPNQDTTAQARKLASKTKGCKSYLAFSKSFDSTTEADSPEYDSGFQNLSNHAYVYKTDAAAKKAFSHASATGVDTCLATLLSKQFGTQLKQNQQLAAQVDDYKVGIAVVPEVANQVGDQAVGYSGGIEVTGTDGSIDRILLTTLVTRVGRAILTYTYQVDADYAASNPTATQTLDSVIAATVARAEAAQA